MVDPHAARALHNGLEDDSGYLVLPFGEDAPRHVEALRIKGLVKAAGGAFHENVLRKEPGEKAVHAVHGIADAHGSLRIAVVAAHGREEVPARAAANGNLVLHGHLEGYFHGHGSGIRVKDVLQSFRHHGEQATPEFHGRPVCQAAEHDMAHGADLAGHGVLERGISVAVDGAPPRGHPVDELRAVREHDAVVMGTRRGVHGKRMERRSVGMPEMLPVKGEHGCVVLSRSPAPGGGFLWRHVLHEITGSVLQPVRVGETRLLIRIEVLRVGQGREERHAALRAQAPQALFVVIEDALFVADAGPWTAAGVAVASRPRAVQDDARAPEAPGLQGLEAQESVVDAAEAVGRDQNDGKPQGQHEIHHVLAVAEGHLAAAGSLNEDGVTFRNGPAHGFSEGCRGKGIPRQGGGEVGRAGRLIAEEGLSPAAELGVDGLVRGQPGSVRLFQAAGLHGLDEHEPVIQERSHVFPEGGSDCRLPRVCVRARDEVPEHGVTPSRPGSGTWRRHRRTRIPSWSGSCRS